MSETTTVPESLDDPAPLDGRKLRGNLGVDSVHDFAEVVRSEWRACSSRIGDWERSRYLASS